MNAWPLGSEVLLLLPVLVDSVLEAHALARVSKWNPNLGFPNQNLWARQLTQIWPGGIMNGNYSIQSKTSVFVALIIVAQVASVAMVLAATSQDETVNPWYRWVGGIMLITLAVLYIILRAFDKQTPGSGKIIPITLAIGYLGALGLLLIVR